MALSYHYIAQPILKNLSHSDNSERGLPFHMASPIHALAINELKRLSHSHLHPKQPPRDLEVPFLYLLIRSRGSGVKWSQEAGFVGTFACIAKVGML
jgi:hypothetical protein